MRPRCFPIRRVTHNGLSRIYFDFCFQMSLAVNLFSGEGLVGNAVRNAVTSIASPMQPAPEVRTEVRCPT